MSLFFDADWFDERLRARGLDRGALAAAAGLERSELHLLFVNERTPSAEELNSFARVLDVALVEVTLRAGVAARACDADAESGARIESIEARLDAIDHWIEEFERARKRA
jgi:hypothetical protein